jgi:hypothetical protein
MCIVDKAQTIRWIVTAALRLLAGYFAVNLGQDAVSEQTWASLGDGLAAAIIAGLSIWTSIKARKTLLSQPPPAK